MIEHYCVPWRANINGACFLNIPRVGNHIDDIYFRIVGEDRQPIPLKSFRVDCDGSPLFYLDEEDLGVLMQDWARYRLPLYGKPTTPGTLLTMKLDVEEPATFTAIIFDHAHTNEWIYSHAANRWAGEDHHAG